MTRRSTIIAAATVAFTCLAIPMTTLARSVNHVSLPAPSATPLTFGLQPLSVPPGTVRAVAHGINQHGDVVGWSVSSSAVSAEIWRISPTGREIGRREVTAPRGYSDAYLAEIDDNGTAVGQVLSAPDSSGYQSAYLGYMRGGAWAILRGPAGGPIEGQQDATSIAIAPNGVIAATVRQGRTGQWTAAMFKPSHAGYGRAILLPVSPHAVASEVGAAYSVGSTTVIGGDEHLRSGDQTNVIPVVWIDGHGPYALGSPSQSGPASFQKVTCLYANQPHTLLAVGYGLSNVDGLVGSEGFVDAVDLSRSTPKIGQSAQLPLPLGATFSYSSAAGGVPHGKPGMYTIGGYVSDWAGGSAGALWDATLAHGTVSIQQPTPLIPSPSLRSAKCPVYQVESMNAGGYAAGFTFCNGEAQPIVVYPQG